ncbi:MAG: DHH family phosphoesterase [Candidatus Hydrogenedentota bacterium]
MKTPAANKARVIEAFRESSTFVITSHVSPDGDAVGSLLGVAHLLRAMGKSDVTCVLEDPVPRVYRWLAGAEWIVKPDAARGPFDVGVIIDAHTCDRTGAACPLLQQSANVVVIDHHLVDAAEGRVQFIDPEYAASGEMVYELFEEAGIRPSKEAADCLYTALTTDTGSFRYSNTTARSHRIAAGLIDAGINVRDVTARVIDTMSRGKYGLLRRVLDRIEFNAKGAVACAEIFARDLDETGALNEDTDGLINYLRNIEGVRLAILFRETPDNKTKVSFRASSDFNAAELARAWGGGGHAAAAGATLAQPISEAKHSVFAHLRNHMGLTL